MMDKQATGKGREWIGEGTQGHEEGTKGKRKGEVKGEGKRE